MHAELEGVICSGPRKGKQFTYALIAERAPRAVRLSRDEALGELSLRYFRSHGPATVRDFVWWSGLTYSGRQTRAGNQQGDAAGRRRTSLLERRCRFLRLAREQLVHLLPIYDEYLIAYRDREVVPHGPSVIPAARTPITFQHALVIAGQVAGTWRTARTPRALMVKPTPLRALKPRERRALADTVEHYQRFQDVPVDFSVS